MEKVQKLINVRGTIIPVCRVNYSKIFKRTTTTTTTTRRILTSRYAVGFARHIKILILIGDCKKSVKLEKVRNLTLHKHLYDSVMTLRLFPASFFFSK